MPTRWIRLHSCSLQSMQQRLLLSQYEEACGKGSGLTAAPSSKGNSNDSL